MENMRVSALAGGAARWLARFLRAEGGNTAMMFGLVAIALIASAGAGIDFTRAIAAKNRMSTALDAAGLAVGNSTGLSQGQMDALAQTYFDANYRADYATANAVHVTTGTNSLTLSVTGSMPTSLLQVVGISEIELGVDNEVSRGAVNLEVALALDVTGSMSGSKITDLKTAAKDLIDLVVQDVQTPFYSKVALAPYSMGVNVGSYAGDVRGDIEAAKNITGATPWAGTAKTITGATRANPVVITSSGHGFANGDFIYISGVKGMTQLNNKMYMVANKTTNTFALKTVSGANVNGSNYYSFQSGNTPRARECFTDACEVKITSNGHGFTDGSYVYITNVGGMTDLNNEGWEVASAASNTFILEDSDGAEYDNYSSGGKAYCTTAGCEYFRFTSASNTTNYFEISTCASERSGAQAFTDASPATALLGRNYPASNNPCPNAAITPLSTNRSTLKSQINSYQIGGSTAGHLGLAWAWYLLSPNFASLWPGASAGAPYTAEYIHKVVVLMTDGAFNTTYCNGVISKDALSGSGSNSDHINCNAPNGDAFDQASALCTQMKSAGIVIYTVGFDVGNDNSVKNFMSNCATSPAQYYLADNGTALQQAFVAIAQDINSLRLSR